MITLGRVLQLIFMLFLLLASVFILGSICGFWGGGYQISSVLVVIITWGVLMGLMFRTLGLARALGYTNGDLDQTMMWSRRLLLIIAIHSVVTGLALGFLAFVGCGCYWLPSLYHWLGLVTAILSFTAYFLLPWIVRTCLDEDVDNSKHGGPFQLWVKIVFPLLVVLIWLLAWLIPYFLLRGSIKESEYLAKDHVYKLPFPGGESSWIIQGNNSGLNHNNSSNGQKYSWDFRRPCGTPILAARGGTIANAPIVNYDGMGGNNNEIDVDHGDGTIGIYLHLQNKSTKLKKGDKVNAGDELAKVGSVGNSMTGHIHFMVKRGGSTVAVSFTDVSGDNGIPRTFHSYTSGNKRVP
jgi:hypothetical protein